MIRLCFQFGPVNGRRHFREHLSAGDHYTQAMKVVGEWLGQGVEQLGLQRTDNEAAFLALCRARIQQPARSSASG
jgi:hypothetical protein